MFYGPGSKNLCLRRFLIKETQMFCARLSLSLASPKILSFENKNENFLFFILYSPHLFVSLQSNSGTLTAFSYGSKHF